MGLLRIKIMIPLDHIVGKAGLTCHMHIEKYGSYIFWDKHDFIPKEIMVGICTLCIN